MAGAAVTRELNARAGETRERSDAQAVNMGVEFAVATRADEAELRALLRTTPMAGAVSLRFEREPDYFAGEGAAGGRDVTILARRGGRVVCMGRCSRRAVYVDGRRCEAGYLGELRLAPGTRGGLAVLRAGYAFFARLEAERPAEFYFTSVAVSNERAREVLESGRLGLPTYEALAELVTVAWPVRRGGGRRPTGEARVEAGELREFLDTQARWYALATPWTAEGNGGLAMEDFCGVRRDGRIVAAGGVWDQSAWRQTVVAGYAGALGVVRPVLNGFARVAGFPGLPAVGARLKQACVHPLAVAEGADRTVVDELLAKLEARAVEKGVEWLVASVAAEDALHGVLKARRGAREYATRLYAVTLPGLAGAKVGLGGQTVRPEAGLL